MLGLKLGARNFTWETWCMHFMESSIARPSPIVSGISSTNKLFTVIKHPMQTEEAVRDGIDDFVIVIHKILEEFN